MSAEAWIALAGLGVVILGGAIAWCSAVIIKLSECETHLKNQHEDNQRTLHKLETLEARQLEIEQTVAVHGSRIEDLRAQSNIPKTSSGHWLTENL
jgi:hypothetical protein